MTGHKGNSEFCFPEKLNVPRGEAEGNIEVEGKQNSLFPEGSVIKCFFFAVSNEKRPTSMAFHIRPTGTQISRGFKVHNVITCKSKVQVVVSQGSKWVLFALGS